MEKKYNIHDPKALEIIINKQLEPYGLKMQDVIDNPEWKIRVNKKWKILPWYQAYTFDSEEEYGCWRDFTINFLRKNIKPKFSKERAEREFIWIDLMWGLKRNYGKQD